MKFWKLIRRPSKVWILRFDDPYFKENGKEPFWALAASFREEDGINDVVVGENEIAFFLCVNSNFELTEKVISDRILELKNHKLEGKRHQLLIRLNGEDLEFCIKHSKLPKEEWLKSFLSIEFKVSLMGFVPYFSYLEGLSSHLAVPRRSVTRTKVLEGSLAIGGGYVGVYPKASPGGWNLIGECLELEKLKKFELGDSVTFVVQGGE